MRFLLLFLSLFLQVSASGDDIHVPRKSHAGMLEGTFVPAAKITEKEQFSTVTNYLGTPEAMYREDGETVWTCELNSYGKVRNFQGESKTMCPFRYQGQYEDAEKGCIIIGSDNRQVNKLNANQPNRYKAIVIEKNKTRIQAKAIEQKITDKHGARNNSSQPSNYHKRPQARAGTREEYIEIYGESDNRNK